jgi:alkyldihydroxyacetonephosphate synthase
LLILCVTAFLDEFKRLDISFSLAGFDRLVRSHGHTLSDIYMLREGIVERIPDVVAWPGETVCYTCV